MSSRVLSTWHEPLADGTASGPWPAAHAPRRPQCPWLRLAAHPPPNDRDRTARTTPRQPTLPRHTTPRARGGGGSETVGRPAEPGARAGTALALQGPSRDSPDVILHDAVGVPHVHANQDGGRRCCRTASQLRPRLDGQPGPRVTGFARITVVDKVVARVLAQL